MRSGLIGFTGFVGGNILKQEKFDCLYNSTNIAEINNRTFNLLVCAAPSAEVWKANQDPARDLAITNSLINHLAKTVAKQFILISTVDVLKNKKTADEDTMINPDELEPYGKHRYHLSEFAGSHFPNHLIVRLPGLFGEGLKKNFIYDMMTTGDSLWTDYRSTYQYYNLSHLWSDIRKALDHKITALNITSCPISSKELAKECFDKTFTNITQNGPVNYDIKSKHASLFGGRDGYLYSRKTVIDEIKQFVATGSIVPK